MIQKPVGSNPRVDSRDKSTSLVPVEEPKSNIYGRESVVDEGNPLGKKTGKSGIDVTHMRVESLQDAVPITPHELKKLIGLLEQTE
jgi:hypothetical protein